MPLGPQKEQILIYGCLHWMQLDSSFSLSQVWAFLPFLKPRYAIFHEPFFHQFTENPDSPPFCYLSLQILIYGWFHWMQLDFSFNLSQLWAFSAFFLPRYAIFREPFFHRLTKKRGSLPFCYPSLAQHPIQCQHEIFGCWGCPWLNRLISEPPNYNFFYFSNPTPGWRAIEKCPFWPF